MSQEIKDKIFAIAQSKPQHEGITEGELEHKHGFKPKEINAALKELQEEGKLTAVLMYYNPQTK
jgi:hypothetical protein